MPFSSLHFDILIGIAEQLDDARDLVQLSQCSHALLPLSRIDSLWKKLCCTRYGVTYNHPNQSYSTLYRQTVERTFGRPPCRHLSHISFSNVPSTSHLSLETTCCQCTDRGPEKVFLCITCHKPCKWSYSVQYSISYFDPCVVCDRHARLHSMHQVFLKGNTGEIFCQQCVDWVWQEEWNGIQHDD